MYTAADPRDMPATARMVHRPHDQPAEHPTPNRPVAPEEICRSEPVLIELQSLLAHVGAESVEGHLMPSLIVHRKRLHMLKHDVEALDSLASDRHAPGHARALAVQDQVQRWIRDGLLVTVRHQPLSEGLKPAAMARFFGLFGEGMRGCVLTQSRETARQMLGRSCWPEQRSTPLVVSVERGGFVTLSPEELREPTTPIPVAADRALRPAEHPAERPRPPAASPPAAFATARGPRDDHRAAAPPVPPPQPNAARRIPMPAQRARKPRATAEQAGRLEQLIAGGYIFVPDTCSLMLSEKQTARRFFERELLPRLSSARQDGPAGAGASRVWLHRRVRGELMRHARPDNNQFLIARAADGLKAVTMLADAGLVADHDDAEGTVGSADSYADPALELLLRKHQHRQRLCILTQDRGLAAKLLAQREPLSSGRAEIVRLCVDGAAAIEDWEGILSRSEREQAAREVSVDARVEAQLINRTAPGAPAASTGSTARPPAHAPGASTQALTIGSTTQGTLKRWKEEQGYGFVQPDAGGPDLFLHISSLPRGSAAPREGDRLSCIVGRDDQGRLRAERAWHETAQPRTARAQAVDDARPAFPGMPMLIALAAATLAGLSWWLTRGP